MRVLTYGLVRNRLYEDTSITEYLPGPTNSRVTNQDLMLICLFVVSHRNGRYEGIDRTKSHVKWCYFHKGCLKQLWVEL